MDDKRYPKYGVPSKQKGLIAIMLTVAMFAVFAVAALALDVNHALLNRTKLQNMVDSAALAAATVIKASSSTLAATTAAENMIADTVAASGNSSIDTSTGTISVVYSNDPEQFTVGATVDTTQPTYVRVEISSIDFDGFFLPMFNLDKTLSVSAVAGEGVTGGTLNIVPIGVCEGSSTASDNLFGYDPGTVYALKVGDNTSSQMGPGNFHLLDFGSGADTVREALAGSYDYPIQIGDFINTKPGASTGPTAQGLNTRFGEYKGGIQQNQGYYPDYITDEPSTEAEIDSSGNVVDPVASNYSFNYSDYLAATEACFTSGSCSGQAYRRVLPIPMLNCTGKLQGATSFEVAHIGCFFMMQTLPTNNSGGQTVFGEFVAECSNLSYINTTNAFTEGPTSIVLYKDPHNEES